MRRVVVWISGRGRAANGMVYGRPEDGGDPCSVRVIRRSFGGRHDRIGCHDEEIVKNEATCRGTLANLSHES